MKINRFDKKLANQQKVNDMNPQLVYLRFPKKQISATLAYLKWMKAFIASDKALAKIPGDWFDRAMNKEEAQKRYSEMIHQAINYKAGIDPQGRNYSSEAEADFRRDKSTLGYLRQNIRMYQFCSKQCRKRLGHLLSERNEF